MRRNKEKKCSYKSHVACKFLFMAGPSVGFAYGYHMVVQHLHIMTRTLVRIRISVGLPLTHLQFVALPGHNSTGFLGKSIPSPTSVCPTDPVVICCLVLWLCCQQERRTWADRPQATKPAQKWPIKCQENYYNSPIPHCLSNLTVRK